MGLRQGFFAVKVSPFSGEYGGGRGAIECGLAEEEEVQTYSGSRVDHYRSLLPPLGEGGDISRFTS